jgi:hypothetical protein
VNRPNEFTPEGARVWHLRPGADPGNPQIGDWNVETVLSPEQQRLYDMENANKARLGTVAQQGLSSVEGKLGTPFSMANVPAAGVWDGPATAQAGTEARSRLERALYDKQTRFLGERFGAEDEALRTRLANQGIFAGSQAYGGETDQLGRRRNEAYQGAMDTAILGAAGEEGRVLQNQLTSFNAQQQSREKAIQEQAYLRALPLNEFNSLVSGAQINMPQFQPYYTGATVAAAPTFAATQAQFGAAQDAANLQASQRNALLGGLAGLGGAAIAS